MLLIATPGALSCTAELYQGEGVGTMWVAYKLHFANGTLDDSLRATVGAHPSQLGEMIMIGDDPAFVDDFTPRAGEPGLHVHTAAYSLDSGAEFTGSGRLWQTGSLSVSGVTNVTFVLWLSGDIKTWNLTLTDGGGVTLLSMTQGTSTFLSTGSDFTGPASASGSAAIVGARATVGGVVSFDVKHSLVGVFADGPQSADLLVATTPSGPALCRCAFGGTQPGTYTFQATGGGAGLFDASALYAGGADVELPQ